MKDKIYKKLENKGKATIKGLGTFYLVDRKKGKSFNGFKGEEATPLYAKRIKFKPSKTLKDKLCK